MPQDFVNSNSTDSERHLSEIWKMLLGLPSISIDDNFFEVGGTSLLATTLLRRVNQKYGRELPIATVFEYTTVRALAAFLRGETVPASRETPLEETPGETTTTKAFSG